MEQALSFTELYRQHAEAIFRLAWMLSGERGEAEDLTAETFARAFASNSRIEQATVRSYLYAIVRNLVASRQRRPMHELTGDAEQIAGAIDPDPGPEQRLELRQRLAHASAGLATLRESDRQVLVLFGVHGMSNQEIADALGLEPGNVRVRLHRARQQLAAFITSSVTFNPGSQP